MHDARICAYTLNPLLLILTPGPVQDFFRNFTAIVLLAVIGTVISSLVAGMGLFHLARAGALR